MTLATTLTRITDTIGAVAGITDGDGVVHNRIRTGIEMALSEAYYLGAVGINAWEVNLDPEAQLGGADGYQHTEASCEVLAHYFASDSDDSRQTFMLLLSAVQTALLTPANLPQVTAQGIRLAEAPTRPVRLPTGQAAYRARIRFRLWDTSNT